MTNNSVVTSFTNCILHWVLLGDQIKQNGTGMICRTHGEMWNVYEILVEQCEDRDHLEGVHVHGRIILKLIQECELKQGNSGRIQWRVKIRSVKFLNAGGGDFRDILSDYQLLQKVSAPRRPVSTLSLRCKKWELHQILHEDKSYNSATLQH